MRNGNNTEKTAKGLATRVKKKKIIRAGMNASASLSGTDINPSRKKIRISIRDVMPSKKLTKGLRSENSVLPKIIPTIYVLRYPLPPKRVGKAYEVSATAKIKSILTP